MRAICTRVQGEAGPPLIDPAPHPAQTLMTQAGSSRAWRPQPAIAAPLLGHILSQPRRASADFALLLEVNMKDLLQPRTQKPALEKKSHVPFETVDPSTYYVKAPNIVAEPENEVRLAAAKKK